MSSGKSLLLLGVSNTGKTVYGAQLFGRIQRGQGQLRAAAAASDIRVLEEALGALERGNLPRHTTVAQYGEIVFPILDREGHSLNLVWPDYGGEQLTRVVQERLVPSTWVDRLREADGWLLMVRPKVALQAVDGLSDPSLVPPAGTEDEAVPPRDITLPTQVEQVELLQILLDIRGRSRQRLTKPPLAVVLSCLDEIDTAEVTPAGLLGEHLPLLAEFLNSTWADGAWRVFGLSALGTSLRADDAPGREAFMDVGPVRSGFLLAPDGTRSDDLTLPVAWLLGMTVC